MGASCAAKAQPMRPAPTATATAQQLADARLFRALYRVHLRRAKAQQCLEAPLRLRVPNFDRVIRAMAQYGYGGPRLPVKVLGMPLERLNSGIIWDYRLKYFQ